MCRAGLLSGLLLLLAAVSPGGVACAEGVGENPPIETVLMENDALQQAAGKVASALAGLTPAPKAWVLVTNADPLEPARLAQVRAEAERLRTIFACVSEGKECGSDVGPDLRASAAGGLADAAALLDALKGVGDQLSAIAKLFQVAVTHSGRARTSTTSSLLAALASELRAGDPPKPTVHVPERAGGVSLDESDLLKAIADTEATRMAAWRKIQASGKTHPIFDGASSRWEALVNSLAADENGRPRLANLLIAESIAAKRREGLLVLLGIDSGGSTSREASNPILGTRHSISGGVVVTWLAVDGTGAVVGAGVEPIYSGFVRVKDVGPKLSSSPRGGGRRSTPASTRNGSPSDQDRAPATRAPSR